MSWFKEWWLNQKSEIKSKIGDKITDEDIENFTKAAYRDALEKALTNLEMYIDEWNLNYLDDIKEQLEEIK